MTRSHNALLMFVRDPVPGTVKTRLAVSVGTKAAAALYRCMVLDLRARLESTTHHLIVVCDPPAAAGTVSEWLRIETWPQDGADLGQRMSAAIRHGLQAGYDKVVLIGSDVPHLSALLVQRAFDALDACDIVLGPSDDGGYFLIGMREAREVFSDIAWSTPHVLEETLLRARRLGLTWHLLPATFDVDTVDDMRRLREVEASLGPGVLAYLQRARRGDAHTDPHVHAARPSGACSLSIIIPTLQEEEALRRLHLPSGNDVEVIIVDGGSSDATREVARALGSVLIAPRGRARQMNAGARVARGDVLLFLHADTHLPPNYLHAIEDVLRDADTVGGAFGKVPWAWPPLLALADAFTALRFWLHLTLYGDRAIFVRRGAFEQIRGYDESLELLEDVDLGRRLRRVGRLREADARVRTSDRRFRARGVFRTLLLMARLELSYRLGFEIGPLVRRY